ncbi:MAG: amidase family protein, partial [bacterium]
MQRLRFGGRIRHPTTEDIEHVASLGFMRLTKDEVSDISEYMRHILQGLDTLDDLPQPRFELKYKERDPGYRPSAEEDPHNLFIRKCYVKGADSGKLAGKRVGVKDTIFVAGVPLTHGSRVLQGYTPDVDAVVIERLLDAGAVIVGKLNQDDFAHGGTSESSAFGCVRNPHNPEHSAGGSSSATGAAIVTGDIDLGLGVDQRGSGRVPAAWCGVSAIKASQGLVPTFGMVYMDHTLDYVCPTARTVREVAQMLEVIAGPDRRDPQWVQGPIKVDAYSEGMKRDVSGIRIGILKEAFGWEGSEPDVNEMVRDCLQRMRKPGLELEEVSIPLFPYGDAIWSGVLYHSTA